MEPNQPRYASEVRELLAHLEKNGQEPQIPNTPRIQREVHFIFVREEDEPDAIDSVAHVADLDTAPPQPQPAQQPTAGSGIAFFGAFVIILCLFCIAAQVYQIVNPFTATVTLVARSQQLTAQGSFQLGRVLSPITVSQSTTALTTGHGHQDARQATGYLTFLNGQFNQVDVPAGTVFTSSSGVQVVTDQDAVIPAASPNPPSLGQVSVPAHAENVGSAGNIPALDINATVSSTLFVKNLNTFTGGQDERNFQTVAKSDIDQAAAPLKATLAQSVSSALQGQLKQGEQLQPLPPCSPTITSDHQVGQEATQVTVTASETCSALAYNSQELTDKVTQLLTNQAEKKLGSGYSLLESPKIAITQVTPARQVTLSFTSVSTWVYGISSAQHHHIKAIIAGKNSQEALQILRSLPGIESTSLQFSGFGDASRIPKNINSIHLTIFIPA